MVDVPSVEILEGSFAVANTNKALDRCVFAGHTEALVRLRELSSSARIALSWDKPRPPSRRLLDKTRAEWLNPYWRLVAPGVVDQMHAAGVGVSVWTVDRRWHMKRVPRAGVDAAITNRTARLVSLRSRLMGKKHRSA